MLFAHRQKVYCYLEFKLETSNNFQFKYEKNYLALQGGGFEFILAVFEKPILEEVGGFMVKYTKLGREIWIT